MGYYIPNFGLFILAIAFTLFMAFGGIYCSPDIVPIPVPNEIFENFQAVKLKCSLPDATEYECTHMAPHGDDGKAITDCCCFSTRCNNDGNLTSKGCAKDTAQAVTVATAQCGHAQAKVDSKDLEEKVMLCRGDMCNGWYPWAKVPRNKAVEPEHIIDDAVSMITDTSNRVDTSTVQGGGEEDGEQVKTAKEGEEDGELVKTAKDDNADSPLQKLLADNPSEAADDEPENNEEY